MNTRRALTKLGLCCLAWISMSSLAVAEDDPMARFDGLVKVKNPRVAMAYVDPEADFSVYKRVAILDPSVSFRKNWKRDQNRSSTTNVRAADVERIKRDGAALFRDVFIERLEAGGFHVVHEGGDDVLVLRPAIIDLDITAPDVPTAGRSRTYTATNGAATLYIELIDSVTGDLLGRAADRRTARHAGGFMTWSNRVTNATEARRMFRRWADKLVEFLNSHYEVKGRK